MLDPRMGFAPGLVRQADQAENAQGMLAAGLGVLANDAYYNVSLMAIRTGRLPVMTTRVMSSTAPRGSAAYLSLLLHDFR
jgi:hypothetical protein